jgi:rRNA maturation protein Nop10
VMIRDNRCRNANHSRKDPPVRSCPMCGDVVNKNIPNRNCSEEEHAKSRRNRNKYCVNCEEQLILER